MTGDEIDMESPIRRGEQEQGVNNQPDSEVPAYVDDANVPGQEEGDQLEIEPNLDQGADEQLPQESYPIDTEITEEENLPEDSYPDDVIPENPYPESSSPADTDPEFSTPENSAPNEAILESSPSESSSPDDVVPESPPPDEILPEASDEAYTVSEVQVVEPAPAPKKIALILSGGGARGAFQVGAEMYARLVKGYQWDIIAGVSVGALNGAMLAMHRYHRLLEIWDHISNDQVYTGGFNLPSVIKILFGAKGFYGNEPLQRMMKREFDAGKIIDDLHVGAVSLVSGEYVQFTKEFLELTDAILASSAIPVIWSPVDVSPDYPAMVDGGVRNISPIGDVLDLEPDEIVIINCGREEPAILPQAPSNVLSIGIRSLDILMNEVFVNDIKAFLRINDLVKEAQESGVVLHHPKSGKPLKYYPYMLIEPDEDLGETLDFSHRAVQKSLRAGVRRARQVLGRP